MRARHPHLRGATRNTLDISAIPVLKTLSHLPMVVDPSHATGIRDKVPPAARAAVAAGADGLLIEVHHQPEKAAVRRRPVAPARARSPPSPGSSRSSRM